MPSPFSIISEDFSNSSQSWNYATVLKGGSALVRVSIRANAYEEQSYAKLEVWNQHGWSFHTSIPTNAWYEDAPRYGKKQLVAIDRETFRAIRDRLLTRFTSAMYGSEPAINNETTRDLVNA